MVFKKCSAPKSGRSVAPTPKKSQKVIPVDFGPKSIFSPKDAANWRKTIDSFLVGKLSYYVVTPATSFFDADPNLEKLVGGEGCVSAERKGRGNFFIWYRALLWPMKLLPAYFLRTTCARNFEKTGNLGGKIALLQIQLGGGVASTGICWD